MLCLVALLGSASAATAQSFEVPANYSLKAKEDYARYNQDVVAAATWLETTPSNQEVDKHKATNQFLVQWLTGTPAVSVEIQSYVATLSKKNPELLVAFLAGWARYQLQHPDDHDALSLNTAGVQTALRVYQLGGLKKDKQVEELLELQQKGELAGWIKSKLT